MVGFCWPPLLPLAGNLTSVAVYIQSKMIYSSNANIVIYFAYLQTLIPGFIICLSTEEDGIYLKFLLFIQILFFLFHFSPSLSSTQFEVQFYSNCAVKKKKKNPVFLLFSSKEKCFGCNSIVELNPTDPCNSNNGC